MFTDDPSSTYCRVLTRYANYSSSSRFCGSESVSKFVISKILEKKSLYSLPNHDLKLLTYQISAATLLTLKLYKYDFDVTNSLLMMNSTLESSQNRSYQTKLNVNQILFLKPKSC